VDPLSTIDALVLGSRLLLAGVFVVAAAAKLWDRKGAREAVVGFGASERAAAPLALLIPVAELAVAAVEPGLVLFAAFVVRGLAEDAGAAAGGAATTGS
jgi:hypothetical protein